MFFLFLSAHARQDSVNLFRYSKGDLLLSLIVNPSGVLETPSGNFIISNAIQPKLFRMLTNRLGFGIGYLGVSLIIHINNEHRSYFYNGAFIDGTCFFLRSRLATFWLNTGIVYTQARMYRDPALLFKLEPGATGKVGIGFKACGKRWARTAIIVGTTLIFNLNRPASQYEPISRLIDLGVTCRLGRGL